MSVDKLAVMIKKLRKRAGLSQNELAKKLFVTDKAVSKWENGLAYPEITLLPKLSEIFGVTIDYMLKENSKGIVVAGNMIADIVNVIDRYPEKNMLGNVRSVVKAVGGCAPNTAIDLAQMDSELCVAAIGRVGDDENGDFLISQMKKYGVDTSKIIVSKRQTTSFCNVMSEEGTGERTFFSFRGANARFDADDVDVDSLDCEIFHIGYACLLDSMDKYDEEYGTRLGRLLHRLNKKGIKTSIDAISASSDDYAEKIIPILKYCSYVIINEIEGSMITKIPPRDEDGKIIVENIKKTMEALMDCGVREKVIIHCREAGFMLNAGGGFIQTPSLILPKGYIKGSVGAGDAYAAGCLYGIYCGLEDARILEYASCAAAASLSESDSVSGMKTKEEIELLGNMYERGTL